MQPALICKCIFLFLTYNVISSLEIRPAKFRVGQTDVYSHNISDPVDTISVTTNTLFCIAVTAIRRESKLCAGKDEKIFPNYQLAEYSEDGIKKISVQARFEISTSEEGWQYYIFKTGNLKGKFAISFDPNFKHLAKKKFVIHIW